MPDEFLEGYRMSPLQEHVWALQRDSGFPPFRAQCLVSIKGSLDQDVLARAILAVIGRHEILRTRFRRLPEMTAPLQVILQDDVAPAIEVHDLTGASRKERNIEINRLYHEASQFPFDLSNGPTIRVHLARISNNKHILIFGLPALCSDAVAMRNLALEVAYCYELACKNENDRRESPLQYADLSEWQNRLIEAEGHEAGRAFWREQNPFGEIDSALPFERPAPAPALFTPTSLSITIDQHVAERIERLASKLGAPLWVLPLACWRMLLSYLNEGSDIVIGVGKDCRKYDDLKGTLGLLTKYLPLRIPHVENDRFTQVVERLVEKLNELAAWEEYFSWKTAGAATDNGATFCGVCYDHYEPLSTAFADGVTLAVDRQHSCIDQFRIKLSCAPERGSLTLDLHYDASLFDERDIERVGERLIRLMAGVVANPELSLGDLDLLTDAERNQVVAGFNDTRSPYPQDRLIHHLFEEQVKRTPHNVALAFLDRQITYDELNMRANRLAHRLKGLGVGPETPVAICVDRSDEMIAGILGVLKAGAFYAPIDPSYPEERISHMLAEIEPAIVLTQERYAKAHSTRAARIMCLDAEWPAAIEESAENPECTATPANLAYVIFTSGSTGKPKGVAVEHGNLVHSTHARFSYYREPVGSFLLLSSFAFDSSIAGIFWTLCQGGKLRLPQESHPPDISDLVDSISRYSVSHLLALPALYSLLLADHRLLDADSLRTVIVAGEACPKELVDRHCRLLPRVELHNEYGPTEGAVWSSVYACSPERASEQIPIGRPIPNTQIYILDGQLRPTPVWKAGEVHLGGAGVVRGYHKRPDATAEKFIPHPFSEEKGARLYRTGDLSLFLPDGDIRFIGRMDRQVKIRGYRIELGEIEATLNQCAGVRESLVQVHEDVTGAKRLIAYLVPEGENRPPTADILAFARGKLPEYMIPATIMWLPQIPVLPNGKIDRRALPAPGLERSGLEVDYVAPRNPVEEQLVRIWSEVLKIEKIGARDNFFDLGGHSLLGTQLVSRILDSFQVSLPVSKLFEAPTIEKLAEAIGVASRANHEPSRKVGEVGSSLKRYPALLEALSLVSREAAGGRPHSITKTSHPLLVEFQPLGSKSPFFCIHPGGGSAGCYYDLSRYLGPDQPFFGVQAVGLDGEELPLASIEEMATRYVEALRTAQPEGPYRIGGWSSGGLIAFEMAQQFHSTGETVSLLALFDTMPPPAAARGHDVDDVELLIDLFEGQAPLSEVDLRELDLDAQLSYVGEQLRVSELIPPDFGLSRFRNYFNVYKSIYKATLNYAPRFYPGAITLFRASDEVFDNPLGIDLGWGSLALKIDIRMAPGGHADIVEEPHVKGLADLLSASLNGDAL